VILRYTYGAHGVGVRFEDPYYPGRYVVPGPARRVPAEVLDAPPQLLSTLGLPLPRCSLPDIARVCPSSQQVQLVFLYGPPGVGKYTIGVELAARTGFRLLHNH
jgi:hypothetical protein